MRVLSGVQSSGKVHLGNYLGALKQHLELQAENECFYFIANYHALTTVQDPEVMRQRTLDVALDYLAIGLDPNKAALYRQTDLPEVCELAWILSCVTGKGLLERAVSYKDKIDKGLTPSMGLFTYPVLQAADILIVSCDFVPVGKDQVQHIEMTQDMAGYFNNTFGGGEEILKRPEPRLNQAMIVPGIDGQKMSKSYGNAIELFDTPSATKKRIMSIVTDSTPVEDPKDPATCNVFAILSLMASPDELADWEARYRAGGTGYGDVKKRVHELFEEVFGEARERREMLARDLDYVEDVLVTGASKAHRVAEPLMDRVRQACGLATARLAPSYRLARNAVTPIRKPRTNG
ncbi:MAG: tryptophan--tRNA ligase [Phycisphaerales bacterium]|nr:tryptophan--tRNA ligase [Phycisphaerales bacterium]